MKMNYYNNQKQSNHSRGKLIVYFTLCEISRFFTLSHLPEPCIKSISHHTHTCGLDTAKYQKPVVMQSAMIPQFHPSGHFEQGRYWQSKNCQTSSRHFHLPDLPQPLINDTNDQPCQKVLVSPSAQSTQAKVCEGIGV